MRDYCGEAMGESGFQSKGTNGHNGAAAKQLTVQRASEIEAQAIEWLWAGRIAIGKQTLIAGEPGLGKSQLTTGLAATVTTGGYWPCDEGRAPLGSVIILSAEDDAADTIVPRLIAAGADLDRVLIVSSVQQRDGHGRRVFNLQADLDLLEAEIAKAGDVRLVIIDPVSSYLGKTDSHKNSDVRGTLEPLGEMAARLRVAVVSVTHFSKGAASAINRFIGSIGFVAAARAAFIVTRDPDGDDGRRLFLTAKNNLARDTGGLAFRLEQRLLPLKNGGETLGSSIAWEGGRIDRTADEVLAAASDAGGTGEPTAKEMWIEFLRTVLSDGALPAKEVEREAVQACLLAEGKPIGDSKPCRDARKALGMAKPRKGGMGEGWVWELPKAPSPPEDALQNNRAPSASEGAFGHERVVDLEAHRRTKAPHPPALGPKGDNLDDLDPEWRS
jgi:putative DNA primase/helicase